MGKQRKSDGSFRADRDWNLDLPDIDDVKTPELEREYQRLLRVKWEAMPELPESIMSFPIPDERWWTHPYGIPPFQQRPKKIRYDR
jgi:hypothetical protein